MVLAVLTGLLWLWVATALGPSFPFFVGVGVTAVVLAPAVPGRFAVVAILVFSIVMAYPLTAVRFAMLERSHSRCLSAPFGNGPKVCPHVDGRGFEWYTVDGYLYTSSSLVHVPPGVELVSLSCGSFHRTVAHITRRWWRVDRTILGTTVPVDENDCAKAE